MSGKYRAEDLRRKIQQGIDLDDLVPVALDLLEKSPLVKRGLYPGDLLSAVFNIHPSFWEKNQDLKEELDYIILEALPLPKTVEGALNLYLKAHKALHACESIPQDEHLKYGIYQFFGNWYLFRTSFAGEQDVINGEADEIGEITTHLSFCITYCPFCGQKL